MFICLRPPPLLDFCLGWKSNFVGSESGQIYTVYNSCICSPSNPITSPPPCYTLYKYIDLFLFTQERGGGVNQWKG
jgi:hypothetical protein